MKIKLCGFSEEKSLAAAIHERPNYIGFILSEGSRRTVTTQKAENLVRGVRKAFPPPHPLPQWIGVFVNAPLESVLSAVDKIPLDGVQLHGEESAEWIQTLREKRRDLIIWKAFRVGSHETLNEARQTYAQILQEPPPPQTLQALLIDHYSPNQRGGTGEKIADTFIPPWTKFPQDLILAGGIGEADLPTCFAMPGIDGIDTSSGLESDGQKDPTKIRAFMERARMLEKQTPNH